MKNVLLITTVSSTIFSFNLDNIKILKSIGYNVYVATNFNNNNNFLRKKILKELKKYDVITYNIPFQRNALRVFTNLYSILKLVIFCMKNRFAFIHCQTPIAGVAGRVAGYFTKTKVIYTAHGFHFFYGAPFYYWLLFYPIEKILSYCTDVLITINNEDYIRAKMHFKAKKVVQINGVGIDLKKFNIPTLKEKKKLINKYKFNNKKLIVISVGELNCYKNHKIVIDSIKDNDSISYYIVGEGRLFNYLKGLISEYNIDNRVHLLGYRSDVNLLLKTCDIFVMPSIWEGLPVSLMEAMATGLPCIVSNVRGNNDLIINGKGGILCNNNDVRTYMNAFNTIVKKQSLLKKYGKFNNNYVKKYSAIKVNNEMKKIYMNI